VRPSYKTRATQHAENVLAAQLYAAGTTPVWQIVRQAFGLDRAQLTEHQRERVLMRLEQACGRNGVCACGQPGQRRGDGGPVTCVECSVTMSRVKDSTAGVTTTKAQPWAAWGGIGYVTVGAVR